jgi:hypothetical protein
MSDIKEGTMMSVLFLKAADVCYTLALNKFRERLKDTERGSEERFHEAMDISKNLGFKDQCLCRLASLLMNISFWFMRDVDED